MAQRSILFFMSLVIIAVSALADNGNDSEAWIQYDGSHMPYRQAATMASTPDSLTPVMINHVGRHGARFMTSDSDCKHLLKAISHADSMGVLTPLGRDLKSLIDDVMRLSAGRWGMLDSLGIAEQEGIAQRMYSSFPELLKNATVEAYSSFVPRCMMSMYAFTHQLDLLNDSIEFFTSTGPQNNSTLRPFQTDEAYLSLRQSGKLDKAAKEFEKRNCPLGAIKRLFTQGFSGYDEKELRKLAMDEYSVVSALDAMGLHSQAEKYFTLDEYRSLWECANIKQYLMRTATVVSEIPARITSELIRNIVDTADDFLSGRSQAAVVLRFGHAETLMPLLSQLRLPGCRYITDDFSAVSLHWKSFEVVPMAANLQFIFFKTANGKVYVRTELNEQPVPLIEGCSDIYVPWPKAREYMLLQALR